MQCLCSPSLDASSPQPQRQPDLSPDVARRPHRGKVCVYIIAQGGRSKWGAAEGRGERARQRDGGGDAPLCSLFAWKVFHLPFGRLLEHVLVSGSFHTD